MSLFRDKPQADLTAKLPVGGQGALITFRCLGCNQPRGTAGSRGIGIRKLCAQCVAEKRKVS